MNSTDIRLCSVEGCARPSRAKGLCSTHYDRQRNGGDIRAAEPIGACFKFKAAKAPEFLRYVRDDSLLNHYDILGWLHASPSGLRDAIKAGRFPPPDRRIGRRPEWKGKTIRDWLATHE